uniref:Uncharacterized protein n=1 Tax=Cannabis sativa TaxID=3483 RepID=A0A803R0I0_CANSA
MEALNSALSSAHISEGDDVVPITCFTEAVNDVTVHFQIIRLPRYMYGLVATLQNLAICMQQRLLVLPLLRME